MLRAHAPLEFLPNWPALMDTATACAYLSMSDVSLRHLAKRRGIAPVDFGGLHLLRWRKQDLDALVDGLAQRVDTARGAGGSIQPSAPVHDLAAAALEKSRRRGRR